MGREDFLKSIKERASILKYEEIIDGVRVVHTGMKEYAYDNETGKTITREYLEMYDADGNSFYCNYPSKEKAEKAIAQLREKGKDAVIGPKVPWRGQGGKPIRNENKDDVGVYMVKQKEAEIEKEPAK